MCCEELTRASSLFVPSLEEEPLQPSREVARNLEWLQEQGVADEDLTDTN